jgi:hypothetical protein
VRIGRNSRTPLFAGLFAAALLVPATTTAQALAGNLDQLRVLVKVGDTLNVTDASGREVRGRVISLSASALELAVGGQSRSFGDNDITSIRQRRGDSLRNGTLIGLGVGAGIGALCFALAATEDDTVGFGVACMGVYSGLGAAIGVGIDAAIRGNQLIFARPAAPARGVAVRPLLGRGRTGVQASITF